MKLHQSRRQFLRALTGATAALGLGGCRSHREPAAARLTVIDTHTHFYDPTRPQGVPWPPKEDALLYRPVLPRDYLALPTPQPVHGTVVVEASPWVEDNQWLLDLAAREPFIVGLVGQLPVGSPDFARHLKRFAAHRLFRGLRLRGVNLRVALEDAAFVSDLKRLADLDLCLDLVGGLDILDAADRIARLCPGQRIVLDHLAGVRITGQAPPEDWVRAMRRAAAHPKVFAKVSGLVEGTGRTDGSAPADVEFYRPVLDVIWELFGPERLVYGSNWPVSERFAPLSRVQSLVHNYFSAKGRVALENVFARNAHTAYRWAKRAA